MEVLPPLLTTILASLASIAIFRFVLLGVTSAEVTWRQALTGWFVFTLASGLAGAGIGFAIGFAFRSF